MPAAATDKLMKVGNPGTATTLSAPGYTVGNSSITVGSTSNWPTDTGVVFAIDRAQVVNGVEVQVPGSYNEYVGTVASGTSVTNVAWVTGAGNVNYTAGALTRVYIPVSATRENRIVDWGLVHANQDGTLKNASVGASQLANNSVTTAAIANNAVTAGKLDFTTLNFRPIASGVATLPSVSASSDSSVTVTIPTQADLSYMIQLTGQHGGTGTGHSTNPILYRNKATGSFEIYSYRTVATTNQEVSYIVYRSV